MRCFFSVIVLLFASSVPSRAATFQYTAHSRGNVELLDQGWTRISFPVVPDPGESLAGRLFELREGEYREIQLRDVAPGKGYYYFPTDGNETLVIEGTPVDVDPQTGIYEISLDAGWTLLGNPFDNSVEWTDVLADGTPILDSDALDEIDVPREMRADKGESHSYWLGKPLKILNYSTYLVDQPYRIGAWEAHWIRLNRPVTMAWRAFSEDYSLEALEGKYQTYKREYSERHRYLGGGTTEAFLDPTHTYTVQYEGLGDSIGYTGVSLAGFLWRGDWDLARSNLKYIADCEDPSDPGHLFRYPGLLAEPNNNVTSRDQYTMVTLGLTVAMTLDGVPDDIYQEAKRLAWNIINRGVQHDWDISPGPTGANSIAQMIYIYERWSELLGDPMELERYPGEAWDYVNWGNLSAQYGAYFQYYGNHLIMCRYIAMAMLNPDNKDLADSYGDFYVAIKGDQNTFGDLIYRWLRGDSMEAEQKELAKFPDHIPNTWEKNYYSNANYRWDRDPALIDYYNRTVPNGSNQETTGDDFMVAYAFLRYALDHPFPDKVPN